MEKTLSASVKEKQRFQGEHSMVVTVALASHFHCGFKRTHIKEDGREKGKRK